MKLKKEDLAKNQFWLLLGVYIPLMLIAIFILATAVAGDLGAREQEIKVQQDALAKKNSSGISGARQFQTLEARSKKVHGQVVTAWKQAWEIQKDLLTWPTPPNDMDATLKSQLTELKFGDKIGGADETMESTLCGRYEKAYYEQAETLQKFFQTEVELPNGTKKTFEPILFLGGPTQVLQIQKDRGGWKSPLSEEVWLLQEDLMIQHELLKAVRAANDFFSHFQYKVGGAAGAQVGIALGAALPAKNLRYGQRFHNSVWQIDLALSKEKTFSGKIKNISNQRQPLGNIFFLVRLYRDPSRSPKVLEVEGETLEPGQEIPIKESKPYSLNDDPEGLVELDLLMEPRFSAVKKIDKLQLNYESLRKIGLKPAAFSIKADPTLAPKPAVAGRPPETKGSSLTPNQLERVRYCEVTNQVRRRPFGIMLAVDQSRIPEVLASLASSKLQIQVTQMHWLHGQATLAERKPKSKAEVAQPDLVAVAIYGLVSLYERYADKPAAVPGKPAARPGTPPGRPAAPPAKPPVPKK